MVLHPFLAFLLLAVLALAVVVIAAVLLIVGAGRGVPAEYPGLVRLRRTVGVARLAAVAFGIAALWTTAQWDTLGRGWTLAPAVAGGVGLLVLLAGEAVARRASVTPGVAALEVRSLRDHLAPRLPAVTAGVLAYLLVLLAAATWYGDPDDMGRSGRSLSQMCSPDHAVAVGPWPGSYYAGPLVLVLFVLGVIAAATYRAIIRRPRNGADPWIVAVDDSLRRGAVRGVTSTLALVVGTTTIGIAGTMAMAVNTLIGNDCAPTLAITGLGVLGWVGVVAGAVLVVWGCIALALSARTTTRTMQQATDRPSTPPRAST